MWVLYITIGVVLGVIVTLMFGNKKSSGRFVMDFTDPVKDVCRLELDEDLNSIYAKKKIYLTIVTYGDNSPN